MEKFSDPITGKSKRIFTVEDLEKLFKTKILSNDESVELIEGEILQRRETIPDEQCKAEEIAKRLERVFGDKAVIEIQRSIILYEIQAVKPSIAVLKPSAVKKKSVEKRDTFFVIELTDLKYNYADNPRGKYYGLFQYPEVWFVNLDLRLVEVCTQPNYGYSRCRTYLRNDVINSESAPDLQIEASKILG